MSSGETRLDRVNSYREAFLAALSRRVAAPTEDWPTVQCWTKSSLDQLFKKVKSNLEAVSAPQSNLALIHWLENLGLTCAIEADGATFYLLEMGASPESEVDPLELMMAYEPSGVVCYLSALAIHSLTSQMPSHHHVAIITDSPPTQDDSSAGRENPRTESGPEAMPDKASRDKIMRNRANPLGKMLFTYLDLAYYLTRRAKRLVPGVQTRSNGPRGRFRITTYEQTLLDTFHKPQSCGGPAVVLEAWREATASGMLDEERLAGYLMQMDYPSTTRRLGAMLQLLEYTPGTELKSCLERAKSSIDRTVPYSQISLLPGFDYSMLDEEWLVKLP